VLDEEEKKFELLRLESNGGATPADFAAVAVDFNIAGDDEVGAEVGYGAGAGAAEKRADASHEFAHAEWLGDVVVGADIEAGDAIAFAAECGEHDDGDGGVAAEETANLHAIDAGEHDIKDDEVRVLLAGKLEGVVTAGGRKDAVAFTPEVVCEGEQECFFVFDDEDAGGWCCGHGCHLM
jgi:hypothetical protein